MWVQDYPAGRHQFEWDGTTADGQPIYIPEGAYDNVEVEVLVSYLDEIEAGPCRQVVFASDDSAGVGDMESRSTTAEVGMTSLVSYADSSCQNCCTNKSNGGEYRYYAYAIKAVTIAEEVKADIRTKWGRLCGEGTETAESVPAHQMCYAAMAEHQNIFLATGRPHQAQVGWANLRDSVGQVFKGLWKEVSLTGTHHMWMIDTNNVPSDGEDNAYRVVREQDTIIEFYYQGQQVDTVYAPDWIGFSLMIVCWNGEINGRETDMPGTADSVCWFDNCQYKIAGDPFWHIAAFDSTRQDQLIGVTRQKHSLIEEWGIAYQDSSDYIWIWDINPWSTRHQSRGSSVERVSR